MPLHEALGLSQAVDTPYPDSPWVVMKFGGRSVATAQNWAVIAELMRDRLAEGVRPVVCHSALVGVSNALIELLDAAVAGLATDGKLTKIKLQHDTLANELGLSPSILDDYFDGVAQLVAGVKLVAEVSPRVHARVLATGELAATRLGAAYLNRKASRSNGSTPASSSNARTCGIRPSARGIYRRAATSRPIVRSRNGWPRSRASC